MKARQLFAAEAAFVRALQATGSDQPIKHSLAQSRMQLCIAAFAEAELAGDVRERILLALIALDIGDRELAEQAGQVVTASGKRLPDWQRAFLEPHLQRLAVLPSWARLLRGGQRDH